MCGYHSVYNYLRGIPHRLQYVWLIGYPGQIAFLTLEEKALVFACLHLKIRDAAARLFTHLFGSMFMACHVLGLNVRFRKRGNETHGLVKN